MHNILSGDWLSYACPVPSGCVGRAGLPGVALPALTALTSVVNSHSHLSLWRPALTNFWFIEALFLQNLVANVNLFWYN